MNLPEGYLLEQLRNRLAKTVNVDPMLLLALSGSTSPIGRIQVRSETVDALLEDQQFPGENLQEILTWDGTEDIFNDILDRYILRAGISGVQPKVLVPERQNVELPRVTAVGEIIGIAEKPATVAFRRADFEGSLFHLKISPSSSRVGIAAGTTVSSQSSAPNTLA